MRVPTETEYKTAKAALAVYEQFAKAYIQPNGWTIIPADAPRPMFEGAPIDVNAFATTAELYDLAVGQPDRFTAYVQEATREQVDQTNMRALQRRTLTTWTGEPVGIITYSGPWHRNNFGADWRTVHARADWGMNYHGREYDSRQFVNFKRFVS